MVADTQYYDTLCVSPLATELEIKKAYRKLAITTHPDKNPGDESALGRFQAIGEAYQVLSNEDLRKQYDKYGKDKAVPDSGFEDPGEFFSMIFGGDAFVDLIGEISLMKDITKTMEVTTQEDEQLAGDAENLNMQEGGENAANTAGDVSSVPPHRVPGQQLLMDVSDEEKRMREAGVSPEEIEIHEKARKKNGLSKDQQEKLAALEEQMREEREKRVSTLTDKLIARLSIWTETDKGSQVTAAFQEQTKLEVENLMMESFGVEILHAIGTTYVQKATSFLKSQKFLGISGFFSRLKDKGALAKDTWGTISTMLDAQFTMEEMSKLEERGGEEWTDERKAEYEKRVTGKILAAAWRGSKFEIQGVLREVCDRVLNDKHVKLDKRIERAKALMLCGKIFSEAERNPDEEGEYMAFEQLMAEGMAKKNKSKKKDEKKDKKTSWTGSDEATTAAAEATTGT